MYLPQLLLTQRPSRILTLGKWGDITTSYFLGVKDNQFLNIFWSDS